MKYPLRLHHFGAVGLITAAVLVIVTAPIDAYAQDQPQASPNVLQQAPLPTQTTAPVKPEIYQQIPLEQNVVVHPGVLPPVHRQTLRSTHPADRAATAQQCREDFGYAPPGFTHAPPIGGIKPDSKGRKAKGGELYADALALHQSHEKPPRNREEAVRRSRALEKSASLYRQTLDYVPGSASTLHNLGRVQEALGQLDDAEVSLRCAAAFAETTERGAYLHRLGEFLERQQRPAAAAFGAAALALPSNDAAHRRAIAAFATASEGDGLLDHLWRLTAAGRGLQAQKIGLRLLLSAAPLEPNRQAVASPAEAPFPSAFDRRQRAELLTIATAALGSRPLASARLLETTGIEKELTTLSRDAAVGDGAADLLAVLTEGDAVYAQRAFSWWRQPTYQEWPHTRGVPAAEAFRKFMTALGSWYEVQDNDDLAAACYEVAAGLDPDDPDPRSLGHLVQVYARNDDRQNLRQVADRYDFSLLQGKGKAYASGDLARIYEYHSTLGNLYLRLAEDDPSLLGDPDNPRIATAIFQLQRAYDTAKRLDIRDATAAPSRIVWQQQVGEADSGASPRRLTPELAAATADAHLRAGDQDQAQFIAFDANRTLAVLGDTAGAKRLETEIPVSSELLREITVEDEIRYELRSPELLNPRGDLYALPDLELIDNELVNPNV